MSVARRWVFPIIRIVLIAVIAVALAKLAFFPDTATEADPVVPTGEITEPLIPVSRGTVTNDLTLKGSVAADPAVAVKSTSAGAVDEIFVNTGATVESGDLIFDVKVETVPEPVETTLPDGSISVSQPKPVITYEQVFAPAAGVVSSISVIAGQTVAIGDAAAQIAPPSFSVTGSLSAEQLYRLVTRPTEAQVAIAKGPAPFTCPNLTITTPLAGSEGGSTGGTGGTGDTTGGATGGEGGGSGSTSLRCTVPTGVTVFAGLSADITLAGGKAENVLTLPTTAVKGSAETGVVYVRAEDGSNTEIPVTLGLTDGSTVEITGGIDEGVEVLQFVPGAEATPADGECFSQPDGSVVCADGGMSISR